MCFDEETRKRKKENKRQGEGGNKVGEGDEMGTVEVINKEKLSWMNHQ